MQRQTHRPCAAIRITVRVSMRDVDGQGCITTARTEASQEHDVPSHRSTHSFCQCQIPASRSAQQVDCAAHSPYASGTSTVDPFVGCCECLDKKGIASNVASNTTGYCQRHTAYYSFHSTTAYRCHPFHPLYYSDSPCRSLSCCYPCWRRCCPCQSLCHCHCHWCPHLHPQLRVASW